MFEPALSFIHVFQIVLLCFGKLIHKKLAAADNLQEL